MINSYAWARDRTATTEGGAVQNYTGLSYHDIQVHLFRPYVRKVIDLINAAKQLQGQWATVSQDLITTATMWCNTLYTVCQGWTEHDPRRWSSFQTPKNYLRPIWHHFDRQSDKWDPARGLIQDPTYRDAEEVWLCSDSAAPPIKPIQVDALLAAFGNGPPLEWQGPRLASETSPGPGFAGTGHPPVTQPPAPQPPAPQPPAPQPPAPQP